MNQVNSGIIQDLNQDINLINPVMRPEEVRLGDPITCKTLSPLGNQTLKLWSYCPFGFEFLSNDLELYKIGSTHQFEFTFGRTTASLSGSIVFIKSEQPHQIGVRINYDPGLARNNDSDRRNYSRWNCPEHLLPSGTAPNPNRFNDFILFKVIDVSSSGLKLATSLRNKLLHVGQILECTLSVPMIGTLYTGLKVNRVAIETIQGKEQLILGAAFVKRDDVVLSTLSEYLLTFAEDCSVKTLRDAGFNAALSTSKFDFSYSKSTKDYEDVLDLRLSAYRESGKLSDDVDRDFMRDEFDSRSRILTVKANGKLVGSARAMFHETGDKTSHERYLKYPHNFPKIDECLEVSRVCVKPEYQGAGLAHELVKHLALLTIKSGRKYVYLSAAGKLVGFWTELGFRDTGVSYIHKQLGNLEHKLLINDVKKSILGKCTSAKAWIDSYSHLYTYCVEYGLIEPSTLDLLRINGYRALGKVF